MKAAVFMTRQCNALAACIQKRRNKFMKTNKLLFLLTGLLAFSLLNGCTKKETPAQAGEAAAPIEITVEIFDRGTDGGKSDPTNNEWTKWIQEKLLKDENIKATFIPVNRWDEAAAMNNLMAAGNPPDVCYTYAGDMIANYQQLGGLFDMAPYVDTLLKDMKAFLGPDTALPGRDFIMRADDRETGKLFAIQAQRMNTAMRNIFMRKDWLEKLELPPPSTPQEFFDALVAFKEQDPGGVGKNNVIPFTMTNDIRWLGANIAESFIDPNLDIKTRWVNQVVERNLLVPGYKEGIRFMNRMYNAGLIDKDFALYKAPEESNNVIKAGFAGAFAGEWDTIYRDNFAILADLQKNLPGADIIPIDPITSSDGITHKSAYDKAGLFMFIPASSKNPEAAMRYLNWLAKFENYHFLQVGPEGVVHDMVDGIPKLKVAPGLWIQNSSQNIDYTMPINGLDLGDPALTIRAIASGYSWPTERVELAYNTAMANAAPFPVIKTTSPLTAAGPVQQTLIDKSTTLLVQAVMAKPEEFDRIWESGVQDWLASGAQDVVNEREAKYIAP